MKHLESGAADTRELSIDELDVVAGGSIWGWIKHEAVAVAKFVGSEWVKAGEALNSALGFGGGGVIKVTLYRQN